MSIVQNIGVFETESSRELQDKCIDTLICAKFSDKSCNKCAKNEGKHKSRLIKLKIVIRKQLFSVFMPNYKNMRVSL